MQNRSDIEPPTQKDEQREQAVQYEVVRAMVDREDRVKLAHFAAIALLFCGIALLEEPWLAIGAVVLRFLSLAITRKTTRKFLAQLSSDQPIGAQLRKLNAALLFAGATWALLILSVPAGANPAAKLAIESVGVFGAMLVIITYGPLRSAVMCFAMSFLFVAGVGGIFLAQTQPPIAFAILTMIVLGAVLFSQGIAQHGVFAARHAVENRELGNELALALERTENLAWRDPMTNLLNRRAFFERCQDRSAGGAARAFLMIDVDHFKRINDQFGHATGDVVIKAVADQMTTLERLLRGKAKHSSIRLGGEEFVMVLEDHDLDAAHEAAERLRTMVRFIPEKYGLDVGIRVSASIGVAVQLPNESLDDVLRRSDLAMYRAKDRGRNQVALAA